MLVHSLLIESVDRRRLGGSASGNDVPSDRVDRCPEAPGDKKLAPLARKGACDSTADRTSGSVDHRNLVVQQHTWFPPCFLTYRFSVSANAAASDARNATTLAVSAGPAPTGFSCIRV